MKLSEHERLEAHKKLKHLSNEMNTTETIRTKLREQNKRIEALVMQVKDSQEPTTLKIELIAKFTQQLLENSLKLEGLEEQYTELDKRSKTEKEKAVNERIRTTAEKEKYSEAIEDIKSTIAKIQKTVKDAQSDEDKKRTNIEEDLNKSLSEIRDKITLQDEEAKTTSEETEVLKKEALELRQGLEALQSQYESKANEKEDLVRKDKGDLLDRLKNLESEASQINKLNTEFSLLEKKNFDNKLTLYIKQTKFSDYAGSFENTARVLSQCKDQLFKGVQKLNEFQSKRDSLQINAKKFDNEFLALLGNNTLKEDIERIKKSKEGIRTNILALQAEIKAKKEQKTS